MSSKLYDCVVTQLAYFGEGSINKFDTILNRSLEYCGMAESVGDSFAKYIYFDFLASLGVIEPAYKTGRTRWEYITRDIFLKLNNENYKFEENTDFDGLAFVHSSKDIFPKIKKMESDLVSVKRIENFNDFILDWKNLSRKSEQKMGKPDFEFCTLEKFCFKEMKWDQDAKYQGEDGLYKVVSKAYDSYIVIKVNGEYFRQVVHEWAYLIAMKRLGIAWESVFSMNGQEIIVPWKVKIPTLLKRVFFNNSTNVSYERLGIKYSLTSEENVRNTFEKVFREDV